tara:strand:+ start:243 stop:1064 length:822 start_codon:yes stop_codon:yes gene_type:complete
MAVNLRLQSVVLVVLLLVSSIGAPTSAQFVDPKQPTPDNNIMYIYGTSDLSSCFMHFDGNDSTGSAEEGFGEKVWPEQNGQQIEMDYTCRLQENFKQDMYIQPNSTINIILNFNIDARGQCNANSVCENLNLTLYKGGIELARQEFPAVDTSGNDDSINWNIDVDRNMTRFNRSGEEPQLRVEFSKPGAQDTFTNCVFFLCGGSFRMYYHTPGNESAEVDFPVMNQSMPSTDDGDEGVLGGAVGDALPGFGLMAGMAALAMAAVASSRITKKD